MNFSDLGLSADVLRAVEDVGYTQPTPIQEQAIPIVLQGRDVLGLAQTGTGKTAGFTLPMIDILDKGRAKARMPRSLILEPTRELAAQVADNFELYGKYTGLTYALLIGGERFDEQIRRLDRGVDVLIATPGRMLDLFDRGKVLLADVKVLVIDEADRMLDMGFIPDIERIVGLLPRIRQTLFFSATMPKEVRRLADAFLLNPKEVQVSPLSSAAEKVEQFAVRAKAAEKREALRQILGEEDVRNALIFCNRKRDISTVHGSLKKHGFNAGELHGDMSQPARTETLERFKKGQIRMMVCSDVAARGIDITDLSHVVNFDVPMNAEDYVHRIGRTGRAGKTGRAFTLVSPAEQKYLDAIEKLIERKIPDYQAAQAEPVTVEDELQDEREPDGAQASQAADKTDEAPAAKSERGQDRRDENGGRRRGRGDTRRGRGDGGRDDRRSSRGERQPPPVANENKPFGETDCVPAFLLRPVGKSERAKAAS